MTNAATHVRCAEAQLLATEMDLRSALASPVSKEGWADLEIEFYAPSTNRQIEAAIAVRAILARTYSIERLRAFIVELRCRVAMLRGLSPPDSHDLAGQSDQGRLEAEALSLLDSLKVDYTFVSERDRYTSAVRKWCLMFVAAAFVALGTISVVWHAWLKHQAVDSAIANSFANYAVLMVIAAAGAVISIMQRTQSQANRPLSGDPVAQISGFQHGLGGILVAGLAGPALGILLVPIFSGRMLEIAGLTPQFSVCAAGDPALGFRLLDAATCLAGPQDSARLLVWAFAAGFVERLVPDVLDRIMGPIKAKSA